MNANPSRLSRRSCIAVLRGGCCWVLSCIGPGVGRLREICAGAAAEPMAVLVAAAAMACGLALGNLGMDFGLFEGIQDNSRMTAADHDAFYRLLLLARNADPARLSRDAEQLDGSPRGLPALFRDPAAAARPPDEAFRHGTPRRPRAHRRSGGRFPPGRGPLFRDRSRGRRVAEQSLGVLHAGPARRHAAWRSRRHMARASK